MPSSCQVPTTAADDCVRPRVDGDGGRRWNSTTGCGPWPTELELGDVDLSNDTVHTLLDLARDSAHEIERIAAPLTTYLVGVAVGRGATLGAAAAQVTELALHQPASPAEGSGTGD